MTGTKNGHNHIGFVRNKNGRFQLDKRKKLGSIAENQIVLDELVRFFANLQLGEGETVLVDVGAGTRPYSVVYERYFSRCFSTDVAQSPHDVSGVSILAPAHDMPFDDQSCDVVLHTEVLEHVPDPLAALFEAFRILKPGGSVFMTTPFMVPLHEAPYDFYRYTPFGLRVLAEKAGFTVESISTKTDYLGHVLNTVQWPMLRLYYQISKLLGRVFYHPYNPLIFLTIVLPQLAYYRYQRRAQRGNTLAGKVYSKLDGITQGYITILRKPNAESR